MGPSKSSPHRVTSLGLILLVVSNVTTYILTRHTSLSEQVVDPAVGFLFGAAIAALLIGIYKGRPRLRT